MFFMDAPFPLKKITGLRPFIPDKTGDLCRINLAVKNSWKNLTNLSDILLGVKSVNSQILTSLELHERG